MFLVLAYPIGYAGYLSFHRVGIGQMRSGEFPFDGLDNYARLFSDPLFLLVAREHLHLHRDHGHRRDRARGR